MPPVGASVNQDPRDRIDSSKVRLNLICVPQAGMGAWAFHGWQKHFPAEVEVLPVEMPGRNSRMIEPKPSTMAELITGLADGLTAYGAFSKPYVLLGHSLGAWVAYELVAEVLRRGARAPLTLVVSGVRAPHLSALEHDADQEAPALAGLDDKSFWRHFERRYGRNPDLADELAASFVLPLLRADFALLEQYAPTRTEPLPCAIIACAAADDGRLLPSHLAAWRDHAPPGEGSFRELTFATKRLAWSTPHRYVVEDPAELQRMLRDECQRQLAPRAPDAQPAPHAPAGAVDVSDAGVPAAAPAAAPAAVPAAALPVIPADENDARLVTVLEEAGCARLREHTKGVPIEAWLAKLDASRPAFLAMLQGEFAVTKLAERQAIANKLGKARREGRA